MSKIVSVLDGWKRGKVHECSIIPCVNRTHDPFSRNPRERWMIGIKLKDSDGSEIVLDICPFCIPLFFPQANEEFFRSMEHTEKVIRNSVTREMVQ